MCFHITYRLLCYSRLKLEYPARGFLDPVALLKLNGDWVPNYGCTICMISRSICYTFYGVACVHWRRPKSDVCSHCSSAWRRCALLIDGLFFRARHSFRGVRLRACDGIASYGDLPFIPVPYSALRCVHETFRQKPPFLLDFGSVEQLQQLLMAMHAHTMKHAWDTFQATSALSSESGTPGDPVRTTSRC